MASNKITFVHELDASKDFLNMKVRILRRWINPLDRLEMVLLDEKGGKIQASVKPDLVPQFNDHIKEDMVVLIRKFGVGSAADDKYPVVKHKLKIKMIFYKSTQVLPDVGFNGNLYGFRFVPFEEITVAKAYDPNVLNVDVIGSVSWCGNLCIYKKSGTKKFDIEMKDLEGRVLKCTFWNDYAVQFNEFVENNQSGEHVIVIIQHGKVKEWNDNVSVQSDKYGTRLYINEDIQEALDLRRRLIMKGGNAGTSQSSLSTQTVYPNRLEFLLNTERKHIDDVREAETMMECVVPATIALIEQEFGWFYPACGKCNKKVLTKMEYLEVADEDELTDELIQAPADSIWCRPERSIATKVVPKFRVTFRVQDSTGSASFTMWDRDVTKVIGVSAADIRQRQISNNDADDFPSELEGLLNQKLAFKIKVDKYNLKH